MSIYDEKPWLKFYDKGIEPEVVIPDASYIDLFMETAEKFPDKPATGAEAIVLRTVSVAFREVIFEPGQGADVFGDYERAPTPERPFRTHS